jgi:predicted  nucleic acid-binding Zn-ribbon protein
MARLTNIFRLQEVDEALIDNRERLAEIDRILAENERIQQAETELDQAQDAFVSAKSQTGEAEQAVSNQRAKLKNTEKSLYGGGVTNPKELEDLQMESESLKRYLETLEDRLLEAMVDLEEIEATYQAAKLQLETTKTEVAADHEDLNQERSSLLKQLERLETEREAAASNVTEADQQLYQKTRGKTGRKPIAVMKDGSCGVCGMAIPGSKQQSVRGGEETVRCPQCGRLLYAG